MPRIALKTLSILYKFNIFINICTTSINFHVASCTVSEILFFPQVDMGEPPTEDDYDYEYDDYNDGESGGS